MYEGMAKPEGNHREREAELLKEAGNAGDRDDAEAADLTSTEQSSLLLVGLALYSLGGRQPAPK